MTNPKIRFRPRTDLGQTEVTLNGGASWHVVAGLPPRELMDALGDSPYLQAPPTRGAGIAFGKGTT